MNRPSPAILLVTSHLRVVERIQAAAAPFNQKVVPVSNAREALKYLQTLPAALVIADQVLPDRSGIDLLQEAIGTAPFTARLLLLEPHASVDIAVEALNGARVSCILRKPLENLNAVREILKSALEDYEREARGRTAVETLELVRSTKKGGARARALQMGEGLGAEEIAGSLIHKFKNTLTVLLGHLELLLEDPRSAELEHRLNLISRMTSDGVKLAQTLQEFMRPEPCEQEPLDLNRIVADTLKMTEPVWKNRARQHSETIRVETQLEEMPPLSGNPSAFREALTNLILNAVDAMPRSGRLTIRTARIDDRVQVEVEDTGIGMSETVRRRIFEPFFTTKGKQGNGLGLRIVQRIIQEHGGDIRVESRPEQGSRFILTLPFAPAMAPPSTLPLFDLPRNAAHP